MTPSPTPAAPTPETEPGEEETLPVEAPILDLDTLNRKRTTVLIDGVAYEMRNLGEFGIEEQHLIAGESKEFDELWGASPKDLKKEQKKRLKLVLDRLLGKALDAPADVVARLDDEQRKRIVQLFTSASAQNWQKALEAMIEKLVETRKGE
jgi:hypothetical protein